MKKRLIASRYSCIMAGCMVFLKICGSCTLKYYTQSVVKVRQWTQKEDSGLIISIEQLLQYKTTFQEIL